MKNRILFPVIQTLLAFGTFLGWTGDSEFVFSLFAFGFVSGIAFASWTTYIINEQ